MNIQKLVAIVAAIAINCAVLAWINSVGVRAVANATPAGSNTATVTLPAINVRPSAEQLRELRQLRQASATFGPAQASLTAACMVMPYYSFAAQCDAEASS